VRLDHLLSKEHHQLWWPSACPSVVGVVAQGWNINEWALRLPALSLSTTFRGLERGLSGGFEVETRYWVVRLHAARDRDRSFGDGFLWWVCGWSSLVLLP
jgi:hypothetical protein